MAEDNQENFPMCDIKITKLVEDDSLRSPESLFNLSFIQELISQSELADSSSYQMENQHLRQSQSSENNSLIVSTSQNITLVETHYINLLQDMSLFNLQENNEIMVPTVMTSLPSISLNDCCRVSSNIFKENYASSSRCIDLPGTHTSFTYTEDLAPANDLKSEEALTISDNLEVLKNSDLLPKEDTFQIKVEQNEGLLNRNSSEFIPCVPQIIRYLPDIEREKPSLWLRFKIGCRNFVSAIGNFFCHNRDFFICLAFFGGFIVCTAFLTAFFYEILTIDPEHIMYPTINDNVYFTDRRSNY